MWLENRPVEGGFGYWENDEVGRDVIFRRLFLIVFFFFWFFRLKRPVVIFVVKCLV